MFRTRYPEAGSALPLNTSPHCLRWLSEFTYPDVGTPLLTYLCPPLTGALLDVSTRCTSPSWLDQIIPYSLVPDSSQSLPKGTLHSCPGHCGHQTHSISQREPLWAISPPHSALLSCHWPPASAPALSLPSDDGQALGAWLLPHHSPQDGTSRVPSVCPS